MAKGPAATTGRRPRRSSRVSRSTWASSASNAARVYTRTAPAVGRGRPRASLLLPRPAWPIRAVAPIRGRRRIGDQGGLGPHLPVLTRVGLPGASNLVPPDRPVRPFPNSNGATSHGGGRRDTAPRPDDPTTVRSTQAPHTRISDPVLPTTNPPAAGCAPTTRVAGRDRPCRCAAGWAPAPSRPGRSAGRTAGSGPAPPASRAVRSSLPSGTPVPFGTPCGRP
jgi:hypothetical protein